MDITQISDVKELKSMAYDESVKLNIAQRNLQVIEARLSEVEKTQRETDDNAKAEPSVEA